LNESCWKWVIVNTRHFGFNFIFCENYPEMWIMYENDIYLWVRSEYIFMEFLLSLSNFHFIEWKSMKTKRCVQQALRLTRTRLGTLSTTHRLIHSYVAPINRADILKAFHGIHSLLCSPAFCISSFFSLNLFFLYFFYTSIINKQQFLLIKNNFFISSPPSCLVLKCCLDRFFRF
jgi:hypothetical protein